MKFAHGVLGTSGGAQAHLGPHCWDDHKVRSSSDCGVFCNLCIPAGTPPVRARRESFGAPSHTERWEGLRGLRDTSQQHTEARLGGRLRTERWERVPGRLKFICAFGAAMDGRKVSSGHSTTYASQLGHGLLNRCTPAGPGSHTL